MSHFVSVQPLGMQTGSAHDPRGLLDALRVSQHAATRGAQRTVSHPLGPFPPLPGSKHLPWGTLYWGGAGLDGPYLRHKVDALRRAGISYLYLGLQNTATKQVGEAGTLVDALRAGLLIRYEDNDAWTLHGMTGNSLATQFNLIGYSYGSLLAAQTANYYAKQGHTVHHLVLIGSPIDADFLATLRTRKHIKKIVVIDLVQHGDPIYAGMSQTEVIAAAPLLAMQMEDRKGTGHFYYAHVVSESPKRWADLATRLYAEGLR
jgi:hypothetical protein